MKGITILTRHTNPNRWEKWGAYHTVAEAEFIFSSKISKQGITAWTWIGPTPEAKKMLADPGYMPPEKCRKAPVK